MVFNQLRGALFPNVQSLQVSPFNGMTDIILRHKMLAVVRVVDCIEIASWKTPTCCFSLAGVIKLWPKKLGELLASMHLYASLEQSSQPAAVSAEALGMLAVRSIGCILVCMVIDEDGSHVYVIHEGGCISIASALDV